MALGKITNKIMKKKAKIAIWFFLFKKKLGKAIPTYIVPGPSGLPNFS